METDVQSDCENCQRDGCPGCLPLLSIEEQLAQGQDVQNLALLSGALKDLCGVTPNIARGNVHDAIVIIAKRVLARETERAEAEAIARYKDALARGLSDAEARAEGWP